MYLTLYKNYVKEAADFAWEIWKEMPNIKCENLLNMIENKFPVKMTLDILYSWHSEFRKKNAPPTIFRVTKRIAELNNIPDADIFPQEVKGDEIEREILRLRQEEDCGIERIARRMHLSVWAVRRVLEKNKDKKQEKEKLVPTYEQMENFMLEMLSRASDQPKLLEQNTRLALEIQDLRSKYNDLVIKMKGRDEIEQRLKTALADERLLNK